MAQRKGCLIGCAVALVVGVGLLVAVVFGMGKVLDMADKTLVDPAVYEAVKTGDAESEVRGRLPSGESFVKSALKEGGPAEPEGSSCSWYMSSGEAKNGEETVLRFCFKDGRLAEKAQYPLK
ncbi:hypothetical protein [Streptomyces nojiriensis]|uniref:DUF4333 domain-containing protein n=1 Tax=Streptomyces nojiriensis TaxID=66374 RepID=A0ABQ3SH92_9ACTN|nr:hypothetical protein [Streptomyces nojiriensis]QTI49136.1 hypothetical protein JYK04_07007 [Streptomyces nojiriensis]GGS11066.1 hypothetical protein GCM10010205_45780 [Streptomyces nojiriensis]GHI67506.1 hypothetical protein Snoj_14240 [Streptomyces nojiriensis]